MSNKKQQEHSAAFLQALLDTMFSKCADVAQAASAELPGSTACPDQNCWFCRMDRRMTKATEEADITTPIIIGNGIRAVAHLLEDAGRLCSFNDTAYGYIDGALAIEPDEKFATFMAAARAFRDLAFELGIYKEENGEEGTSGETQAED